MKKKILALLTAVSVVFSMIPVAFAATHAEETALAATDYMSVTKDESGKTTAFSIDFETGIDPITKADLEPVRIYTGANSKDYTYYIANYGTDEGEWNGALNRAYLYATQDVVNYKPVTKNSTTIYNTVTDVTGLTQGTDYFTTEPGQLFHEQWTKDGNSITLNPRASTTPITTGSGNYLGYTPNVVAGGKYFPEITAFSHAPSVQNGAAYSGADTATILGKYTNEFGILASKGDISNLSVTTDPKNSSNKVVKMTGSANSSTALPDFSVIGKENVELSNKVTKFEAKVYIEQDKTISDSAAASRNKKPFTMQIAKNANFSSYLDGIKNDGLMYTSAISATRNIERILNGSENDEYLDAVTFHNGKIYLGTADGTEVGAYTTGKWYTVRYYLDTTKSTPVNAVEVFDSDNNLVASARRDVTLNAYGTFGWLVGDDSDRITKCQEKYSPFSGFDADSTYSVFLRNDTYGYDGVAHVDFVGYVDDISFAETDYVAFNNNSREFTQDFEHPDYDAEVEYSKFYSASNNSTERYYISNGDAAKAALASNSTFLVQGDLYENQWDGTTLKNPAVTNPVTNFYDGQNFATYKANTTVKTENFRTGGLAGYTGFTNAVSSMVGITGTKTDDAQVGKVREMFVIENGDKELSMIAYPNTSTALNSWFGKEGMDIYGHKSKISFDLKNKYAEEVGNAIVTLSITKNTGNLKSKIAAKTAEYAFYNGRSMLPSSTTEVTDAVTIYGGKAYIGNGINGSTGAIDETKYICDMTDTAYYTVDVYLDYETDVANPTLTVVIKNADGSIKAMKTGALPVSTDAVFTSVHAIYAGTGISVTGATKLFQGKGVNSKATFSAAEADSDGYGVFVALDANGTGTRKFIDNFTFAGYDASDVPVMGMTATIDEATKTLTARIISLAPIMGKLIVAEYAADSKAMLQTAFADVNTSESTALTAVFENPLTPGSKYKVFLWDGFTNINPLIKAFEPKFIAAE